MESIKDASTGELITELKGLPDILNGYDNLLKKVNDSTQLQKQLPNFSNVLKSQEALDKITEFSVNSLSCMNKINADNMKESIECIKKFITSINDTDPNLKKTLSKELKEIQNLSNTHSFGNYNMNNRNNMYNKLYNFIKLKYDNLVKLENYLKNYKK
jgi:hypothetical protein